MSPFKNLKITFLPLIIAINLILTTTVTAANIEEYENEISSVRYKDYKYAHTTTLLSYKITNGITREYIALNIDKNGEITYNESEDFSSPSPIPVGANLEKKYVQNLINLFDKNKFLSLKIKPPHTEKYNKEILYTIDYNGNSGQKNVTFSLADNSKKELLNVISELDTLIKAIRKKEQEFKENVMITYFNHNSFGPRYRRLTICKDSTVYFTSQEYDLKNKLNKNQFNKLLETFNKNNFFSLKDEYPSQVIDAGAFTIFYNYNSKTKNMHAGIPGSDYPKEIDNIRLSFDTLITELKKDINSGFVTVNYLHLLKKWPFGSRIKLSDSMLDIPADKDVFNYVNKNQQNARWPTKEGEILYFEDNSLYSVGLSEEYSITVHKLNPVKWPQETNVKLSDLLNSELFIEDTLYQQIKKYAIPYPNYFIDSDLKDGNCVYEIFLTHSTKF